VKPSTDSHFLITMNKILGLERNQAFQPSQMYAYHITISSTLIHDLCLRESFRETLDVLCQIALVAQELNICSINLDSATGLLLHVFLSAERGEAPVLGDNDLLATRELVL